MKSVDRVEKEKAVNLPCPYSSKFLYEGKLVFWCLRLEDLEEAAKRGFTERCTLNDYKHRCPYGKLLGY